MAGRIAAPPNGAAPLGNQTAAEIAGWQQVLANARTRARVQAAQQATLDQANADTVDSLAQSKVDRSAKANAVALRSASVIPSERGDIPGVAANAAVASAMNGAARVAGMAGALPDQSGTRLEVGLPATDTHPNGTPMMPDGTPLQFPAAARRAPAQGTDPAAGTGTAAGPFTTPTGAPGSPTGPLAPPLYLSNHLMAKHGISLTPELYDQGIDAAVAAGHLNPAQGGFWRSYRGEMDNNVRDAVAQHIAGSQPGQLNQAGIPADSTVSRPVAYLAAAQAHHADLSRAAAELDAAGLHGSALAARTVRDANNQTPETDKATIWNNHLATLPPAVRAQAAARVTVAQLAHGKPKDKD
jgi:hypothetical protein